MRFAFTAEQLELRDAVARVLDGECSVADLRAIADDPVPGSDPGADVGRSDRRWGALHDLGADGLLVPEGSGGLGLTDVELVGLLEVAGSCALPEPLAETAGLAAPLLGRVVRATVGGIDVTAGAPAASSVAGDVDGQVHVPRVPGLAGAEVVVLCTAPAPGAWEVHTAGAADVTVTPTPNVDPTRPLARVTFTPSAASLLVAGEEAAAAVGGLADRGAFVAAAQLLGLADRLITMSAEYVTARHQFGVPVGSFQAVKHQLADARVRLEFARPAVYRAAWSLATADPDRSEHCSMAKALASDAGDRAARTALQVHGAIGYTWECDLHFFMKRAWALSAEWGSPAVHRSRVLAAALGRVRP